MVKLAYLLKFNSTNDYFFTYFQDEALDVDIIREI